MRKLLLTFVGLIVSTVMLAGDVSKSEALKKAQRFMPGRQFAAGSTVGARPAPGQTAPEQDAFYVFNAENNGGFVIVSGDDRTAEILGYSRTGRLDMDKIPENMKWWLESYAQQIAALGSGTQASGRATTRSASAISPLILTKWDQYTPYNLMCPDGNYVDYDETGYDASKRCVTGCVATAMAQVMYYHQWPSGCSGVASYSMGYYDDDWNFVPTHTFKALPAIEFKWSKMKKTYSGSETDESATAVAELMRYCGQAVSMEYDLSENGGSGAYLSPSVLVQTFGYNKNLKLLERDNYTTGQWEEIVYNELAANRPVLYTGRTPSDEYGNSSGHEFIVDGYDGNGCFHINWGWSGTSDDYFVLSVADPAVQGAGGSASNQGFRFYQTAMIGVQPSSGETLVPTLQGWIDAGSFLSKNYTRESAAENFEKVSLTGNSNAIYNIMPEGTLDIKLGWGLYQNDEFKQMVGSANKTIQNETYTYLNNDMTVTFGSGLADGKYQLSQVYQLPGETTWTRCDNYGANSIVAEVSGNSLTVRLADTGNMQFTVQSMNYSENPEKDSPVTVYASVTNTGESSSIVAALWAKKQGTSTWTNVAQSTYYVDPGKSGVLQFTYTPTEAGTFDLKVTSGSSDEALGTTTITIASTEIVIVDNVTYLCAPANKRATVISNDNIENRWSITSVNILQTVTASGVACNVVGIGNRAFWGWNLTSITIPEGITTIGQSAFAGCSLVKVVLPSTVTSIGWDAFWNNPSLATVVSYIAEPFSIPENAFKYYYYDSSTETSSYLPSKATLYVPIGKKSAYETAGWDNQFAKIEEGEVLEATVDGLKYEYSTGGTTATVIQDASYKNLTSAVTIPTTVSIGGKAYSVTAIGNRAFNQCSNIPSIVISDGIKEIGISSFEECWSTTITLPNSLKKIDNYAFWSNGQFKELVLPEGLESIGVGAFAYCSNITKIILPSSLTSIGGQAFIGTSNLSSVVSRISSPMAIAEGTFAPSSTYDNVNYVDIYDKPTATLYVPEGKKATYQATAGWNLFDNIEEGEVLEATVDGLKYEYSTGGTTAKVIQDDSYKSLTSAVTIPASVIINGKTYSVTGIGNNAFNYCSDIPSIVISEGISEIGTYAFQGCWNTTFTLPNSLKTIGSYAFWSNNRFNELILPDGLETLGEGAFGYCGNVTKIELPSTLTSIGERAFIFIGKLTTVISKITSPYDIPESAFAASSTYDEKNWVDIYTPTTATLVVPEGTKAAYEAKTGWNLFPTIAEGELNEAMSGVLKYSYVTGGTAATVIQDDSYQILTEVNVPASVTFSGKTYNVTTIGGSAFESCYKLETITLSEGVETIGYGAFRWCGKLATVNLPKSLKTIGDEGFFNSNGLTDVVLPEGLETIGRSAFAACYGLKTIVIPSTVTSIGYGMLNGIENIESVTSRIKNPFNVSDDTFVLSWSWDNGTQTYTSSPAKLYVPEGTSSLYNDANWSWQFSGGVEEYPTKVTFTIGEAGKTTYVGDYNLDFTGSDLAAYVVTGYEKSDGTIWLTRVYDVPAGTPIYLKGAQGSYDVDISDASTSYYQNLMLGNNSSESLTVTSDATDQYYNVTASGFNIINGSKSIGAHKCYLRLPTTLPAAKAGSGQSVKITSAGKTTLCSDVDLDFSGLTNVKAYTATGYDKSDGTIWMTRVERASAGTPLYIKGDEGTWTIPSSAQQTYYANMLKGNNSDASLTINATDGEYTNHFLAASGFSTFEGTKAIGAHKSYLQILTSYLTPKSGARGMSEGFVIGEREGEVIALTLGAGDGETTGIKAVGEFEGDAEVIYNLNGQRVENPGKGLFIINGRKVVIK